MLAFLAHLIFLRRQLLPRSQESSHVVRTETVEVDGFSARSGFVGRLDAPGCNKP